MADRLTLADLEALRERVSGLPADLCVKGGAIAFDADFDGYCELFIRPRAFARTKIGIRLELEAWDSKANAVVALCNAAPALLDWAIERMKQEAADG